MLGDTLCLMYYVPYMFREGLIEKVTFEQIFEGRKISV